MRSIEFGAFFEGAVSVESRDGWYRPWRLPHFSHALFPSPDNSLVNASGAPSGVRLRFRTDSPQIELRVSPMSPHGGSSENSRFDLTIENEIVATCEVEPGSEVVSFEGLPTDERVVEIWLPPGAPVWIHELRVDDQAVCEAALDTRKRWITYGSSLTHCVRANSAAKTWPAIVARSVDVHLTCLGFGGQCHMDPMVAMTIRELPADFISLKCGINIMGHGSLNIRTFAANMIGMVRIIRDKHPITPIALVTAFSSPPRESEPNAAGMTLEIMREQTREVHRRLVEHGDSNLMICDGLSVVDAESIAKYSEDQCHHNGDGIEVIADRWLDVVMPAFGLSPRA